jgi:hypothetical protein
MRRLLNEHAPNDARQLLDERLVEHLEQSGFEIDEEHEAPQNRLCYVQPDNHNLSHRSPPPVHTSRLTLLPEWRAVHGMKS